MPFGAGEDGFVLGVGTAAHPAALAQRAVVLDGVVVDPVSRQKALDGGDGEPLGQ